MPKHGSINPFPGKINQLAHNTFSRRDEFAFAEAGDNSRRAAARNAGRAAGFAAVLAVAFLAAAERPQLLSTQFSTDEMLTVG